MECGATRRHRCYLKRASRPARPRPIARRSRSSAAGTAALRSVRRRPGPGSSRTFVPSARANPKLYAFASICKNYAANVQCARNFARDSTALSPARARWHVACEDHESSGPASSEAFPFSRPRWAERWPRCPTKAVERCRVGRDRMVRARTAAMLVHAPLSYVDGVRLLATGLPSGGVALRIWRWHAQHASPTPICAVW